MLLCVCVCIPVCHAYACLCAKGGGGLPQGSSLPTFMCSCVYFLPVVIEEVTQSGALWGANY